MLKCDDIVIDICESLQKGENFLKILGKVYVKFEQFQIKFYRGID